MRMLPMVAKIMVLTIVGMIYFIGFLTGCSSLKDTPEDMLIKSLDDGSPIFFTDADGLGVAALGPEAAKLKADDAVEKGIDLLDLYKENFGSPRVRLGLAYLLLMRQDVAYVEYAITRRFEITKDHEFRLWTYLLGDDRVRFSQAYRSRLEQVLADIAKDGIKPAWGIKVNKVDKGG